ncbi:2-polyprenyl-6-hydroxyphenyl methylase/3-demethylubiquinone-9 3-methyltransferase [Stackebrandtia albiflava]|uniref:2-polyprenyl-6-hydroxyphenyl methylase/3-demethylubiquinone-9 3-methyltransferase n=1 Tax=Stackebrandtia albiflava TaxID=406432 RepID=A0A562V119_9ACTN|nr:methyltransferase domain-containing protein [Stackebrandtia albiflava]TWJ11578.1 2-polyprenyl-6-hydroxyphenyl methylase/3-demethylubiquinone-9 3-methyltransferase [Stackebrandtia albiflava]
MSPRNDPRQYDRLAAEWWRPAGAFAMLHWLAESRCALVPAASRPGAVLVDVGCGGGLNAPWITGYRHVGLDIRARNAGIAAAHGVLAVQGDAMRLPLPDGVADVVIAGEILEHVTDWRRAVAEACRVLRPGGTLIVDTIARTALATVVAVWIAERIPGGPPPGIHDPALFVPPRELREEAARHGVDMRLWGLRPAALPMLRWLWRRRGTVPIATTRSLSILYAGKGVKNA